MSKPSKDKAQRRAERKRREAAAEAVRDAARREKWRLEEERRRYDASPEGKRQAEAKRIAQWEADAPKREAQRKERRWEEFLYWEAQKPAHCFPPRHSAEHKAHKRHTPEMLEEMKRYGQPPQRRTVYFPHAALLFGMVAACGGQR